MTFLSISSWWPCFNWFSCFTKENTLIVFCKSYFPIESCLVLTLSSVFTFSVLTSFLTESILCDPNYRACLHLVGYRCMPWYFIFLILNICRSYLSTWRNGLVWCVLCVYLTWVMYHQYAFAHNLGTRTSPQNLPVLILW